MKINIFDCSDLCTVRQNWGRMLLLGIFLIVLGLVALINTAITSIVSMYFLGWILILTGAVEAMQAIHYHKNGRFFLHVIHSVLSIVVGCILLAHPVKSILVATLLIAAYFCVMGVCRIVTALSVQTPCWGWTLADGIICLILGVLIWAHWPTSALWMIGFFIGINLLFSGWSQVMLAVAIRNIQPIDIPQ